MLAAGTAELAAGPGLAAVQAAELAPQALPATPAVGAEVVALDVSFDLALDVAVGEWDGFGTPADYIFSSVTIAPEKGPYYKFGSFGDDFDGDYFELGYTYSIEEHGVDLSVAVVTSDDLNVTNPDDEESGEWALAFGIKKNIGIGQ